MKNGLFAIIIAVILLSGIAPLTAAGAAYQFVYPKEKASIDVEQSYLAQGLSEYLHAYKNGVELEGRSIVFQDPASENYPVIDEIQTVAPLLQAQFGGFMYASDMSGITHTFDFGIAEDSEYAIDGELYAKLNEIVGDARAHSDTQREQLEFVYNYLINNVSYSTGSTTFQALLVGVADCDGYSSAVNDICVMLGIPSVEVLGKHKSGGINHAWNLIYAEDKWLMLDAAARYDWREFGKLMFLAEPDDVMNDSATFHGEYSIAYPEVVAKAQELAIAIHKYQGDDSLWSPPEQPSSWAATEIEAAVSAKIVPTSLRSEYTRPITRAEFCSLAVALYERRMGWEISGGKIFDDTNDVNVQKMAGLGIVSGVGDNKFDPNSSLTREQAAAMLARLADAVGKPLAVGVTNFADNDSISPWAFEQVGQAQSAGIMTGVGGNTFAPKDSYTREQSIITMARLWDIVNVSDTSSSDAQKSDALLDALTNARDELKQFSQSLGYSTGELYDVLRKKNDPDARGSEIAYASLHISNSNWRFDVTLQANESGSGHAYVTIYEVFAVNPEMAGGSKAMSVDISMLKEQLVYYSTIEPDDLY